MLLLSVVLPPALGAVPGPLWVAVKPTTILTKKLSLGHFQSHMISHLCLLWSENVKDYEQFDQSSLGSCRYNDERHVSFRAITESYNNLSQKRVRVVFEF